MSDFDIFPTLDEPATAAPSAPRNSVATKPSADVALDDIDLTRLAVAHFEPSRAALKTAAEKLTDVVHDLSTPGKLADAKSLRHRLINIPLAEARKVSGALKSKLTAASKAVGAELTSIEAGFEAAESFITPQIEARDAQVATEKAERERIEAERVAGHRANIAVIAGYVTQAQGKTSTQILTIINGVSAIDILPEQWEEFAVGAEIQKGETLEALHALFDRTKTAEHEAAAREAQRLENERAAAALAEQARILAEKQAELDAKLAKIAAAEKAEADRIAAEAQAQRILDESRERFLAAEAAKAEEDRKHSFSLAKAAEDEANRLAQEAAAEALQTAADATPASVIDDAYSPTDLSDDALAARPEIADQVTPVSPPAAADMEDVTARAWGLPASPITFAEPPAPPADEPATLTLGAINARFGAGFTMTVAFVTDVLGVKPAAPDKAAKLFTASQFTAICDALVEHIGSVCGA